MASGGAHGQELRHDPLLHLALRVLPLGRDRVHLVDEEQRRRRGLRLLKQRADEALRLAACAGDDLRRGELEEGHAELARDGVRQQRLAAAGRAVQEHAAGSVDAEVAVDLRVGERPLDELADGLEAGLHAAHVAQPRRRPLRRLELRRLARARRRALACARAVAGAGAQPMAVR